MNENEREARIMPEACPVKAKVIEELLDGRYSDPLAAARAACPKKRERCRLCQGGACLFDRRER
jgi:hypothetical protein